MGDDKTPEGMTFRELLLEMRGDIKALFALVDRLDDTTVKKEEMEMWRTTQINTRRWAVTTIISLAVLGMMILGAVLTLTNQ